MRLYFSGADHEVTGSCHCIEANNIRFLIDCGMEQGQNYFENQPVPFSEKDIDFVLLTHAHIDHSGMLPLLWKKGFRGKIYSTIATAELSEIMLRDCGHIQETEAEWQNRKRKRAGKQVITPLYTINDAEETCKLFTRCHYNEIIEIYPGIKVRFTDIGHMLGSSCIELWLTENSFEKKIVFSGDVGNVDQPIVKNPSLIKTADYVVIESTYGNRYHTKTEFDYSNELSKIISDTFKKGGNVVIPSFAVGRTQEILYFLREIKEQNLVPDFPGFKVYLDSPMAIESTEVFNENTLECFDDETLSIVNQGINPIYFDDLSLSLTSEESIQINQDLNPKVIIASSGMCEGGRIRHHLKHNLWRFDSTILFVGYQSVGTLGRLIVDGTKEVQLFGETISVNADIKTLEGISGHADKAGLQNWLSGFDNIPGHVFVVHGEDSVCTEFASFVTQQFNYHCDAPYSGSVFNLLKNEYEIIANPVFREKIKHSDKNANDPFILLQKLGRRITQLISSYKGRANRDIRSLYRDLEDICEKYEND